MKRIGQIVAVLLSVSLLGAMGVGAYAVLQYVLARFASLDPQVANVAGIACVVVLMAAWVIARAIGTASRQSKTMALREEKTATYQLFVDFWENLLRQGGTGTDQLPADLSEKLQLLERLLALYGGTAVIKEHTGLRGLAKEKGTQHPDVKARLAEALVTIRKDLGVDTPYDTARALERLLVPALDGGGTAEAKDARIRTALAFNS